MLPLDLAAIDGDAIVRLVALAAREGRQLDFKRDIYGISSPQKDEQNKARRSLSSDLVALANTSGGDIVVGIVEIEEVAAESPGVLLADANAFAEALPSRLLHDAEPALRCVEHRVIPHPDDISRAFVVIRVRPSLNAPHRTLSERIFYERIGTHNTTMDIPRIREAFLRQSVAHEAFETFRRERFEHVRAEQFPLPWFLIHMAPLHALSGDSPPMLDFKALDPRNTMEAFTEVDDSFYSASGFRRRTYARGDDGQSGFHVFFDGKYEHLNSGALDKKTLVLPLTWLFSTLKIAHTHFRLMQAQLGNAPFYFGLCATQLEHSRLGLDERRLSRESRMADADVAWCPTVRFDSLPSTAVEFVRNLAPSLLPLFLSFDMEAVTIAPMLWQRLE